MDELNPVFMLVSRMLKVRGTGAYEDMSSLSFQKRGFFLAFRRKKNFENPTKFDRVRAKNGFVFTIFQRPTAPLICTVESCSSELLNSKKLALLDKKLCLAESFFMYH